MTVNHTILVKRTEHFKKDSTKNTFKQSPIKADLILY